jgi:hypothetical protein
MSDFESEPAAPKRRGRPFAPGNPGRPKGARNQITVLAEGLLNAEVEAVVRSVIEAAKAGDMTAARIILDRVVPVPKGRPVRFELPTSVAPSGLAEALAAVLAAVAQGELTPEEGTTVAALLETHCKAIEIAEFDRRLTALEAKRPAKR